MMRALLHTSFLLLSPAIPVLPYVIPAEARIQEILSYSIGSGFPLKWRFFRAYQNPRILDPQSVY